jgi:hypothetical protein
MAGRLTRFLNLERRRKPGAGPAHAVVTEGRFVPRPELELAPDHGEQPFLRCPSCEADNSRFASRCVNCGSRLDTEEVRAFNDQLWEGQHAQAEVDRVETLERQRKLESDRLAFTEEQRELGESIAREVGERERVRLGSATPLGLRLLSRLEGHAQIVAVVAAAALFLLCAFVAVAARDHPLLRGLGAAGAVLLLALFCPRRRRLWD